MHFPFLNQVHDGQRHRGQLKRGVVSGRERRRPAAASASAFLHEKILAVHRVFHDGGDLRVGVIIPLVLKIPQRLPHVRHHLRVVLITLIHAPLQRLLHFPALHQILDVAPRVRRVAHDQLDHRHPHVAQRVAFPGRPRLQGGGAERVVHVGVFLRAGFARVVDQRVCALLLLLVAMDDEWEEGDGK
nr:hypothetical protein Itr_chr12CG02530 [Ipomoea trifida]